MSKILRCRSALVSVVCCFCLAALSFAADLQRVDIPAGELGGALQSLTKQTGIELVYQTEAIKGVKTKGVSGTLSPVDALTRLLEGTGLKVNTDSTGAMLIAAPQAARGSSNRIAPSAGNLDSNARLARSNASGQSQSAAGPQNTDTSNSTSGSSKTEGLEEIIVTGTHIHNVAPISPVITITHEDLVRQGYSTIAQAIEQLPQNFLGAASPAANPISGFGGGSATLNLTFASSINLRGLGPNATLVLLNGRRMAPEAITGAADISAIPVNVIDRIEILTDGASSVYGADAVAGVVNIITRQNFSGLQVGAGVTGISEGKTPDHNANVMGGFSWTGGGLVASADFEKDNPLYARNRYFTDQLPDPWALTPKNETANLYLNLHQEISDKVTLSGDMFATRRDFEDSASEFGAGTLPVTFSGRVYQYNASLELDYRISSEWNLSVVGQASKEQEQTIEYLPFRNEVVAQPNDYRVASLESRIDGRLFDTPGGAARAAIGAQFRREDFDTVQYESVAGTPFPGLLTKSSRHESSAYGELVLPLIGKDNAMSLVQDLRLDFSGRYDNYSDFGHTFNPRVGLQWKPVSGVTLHGSYSRSFQVPTLYEASSANQAALVGLFSDPESASGSTLTLLTAGGNPNLQPEKAKNLNFGVTYEPSFATGLKIDASYFSIHFDNRIITLSDLGFFLNVLQQESVLGSLVERNPPLSQITQALNVPGGAVNWAGGNFMPAPYVPGDIKALVPLGYINASTDTVAGEDLAVHYTGPDLKIGRFRADVDASYFNKYNYQLAAGAPTSSFLNIALNPLRLRAKANVGWAKNAWSVNARINFSNKYGNTQNSTESSAACIAECSISSWATVDFGLSYAPLTGTVPRWLEETRLALIVTNAFNRAPPSVTGLSPNEGFDPFNANPLLRTFGVTFTKRWGRQGAP